MGKGDRRRRARHGWGRRGGDLFYRGVRGLHRHVGNLYAALGIYFVLSLVIAAITLVAFAWVADLVEDGITEPGDTAILLWMARYRTPLLTTVALEITDLGGASVLVLVALISSVFLWVTHRRYSVLLLWVAMVGGTILNTILKVAFARPRPPVPHLTTVGFYSFPSGHAMNAMVFYGILAYLLTRITPSLALRRATLAVAAIVILLIGLSRLYLGVHYPSDVLGGYLAGFTWATLCAFAIEVIRHYRDRRRDLDRTERGLHEGVVRIADALRKRK